MSKVNKEWHNVISSKNLYYMTFFFNISSHLHYVAIATLVNSINVWNIIIHAGKNIYNVYMILNHTTQLAIRA